MKIVCVASFANNAGAQNAIVKVARCLRSRGHRVDVIFLYGNVTVFEEEPFTQILVPVQNPGLRDWPRIIAGFFRTLWKLRPEVVLSFLPLANALSAVAGRILRVPRIIVSHRSPVATYSRAMRAADRVLGSLGFYTKIICVSNAVAAGLNCYSRRYRRDVLVIHNGVEQYKPVGRASARASFKLTDDEFIYAAVGRLSRQKNYHDLLRWFSKTSGGRLIVAGEGEDRDSLEASIQERQLEARVTLVGNLRRDQARLLLEAADVFVQPSLFEGQSNAVLEAMAAGLPMLLSDIPEQREVVARKDGDHVALLLPLNDEHQWVAAFDALRLDSTLRQRLGTAAHSLCQEMFTVQRMTDQFEHACAG